MNVDQLMDYMRKVKRAVVIVKDHAFSPVNIGYSVVTGREVSLPDGHVVQYTLDAMLLLDDLVLEVSYSKESGEVCIAVASTCMHVVDALELGQQCGRFSVYDIHNHVDLLALDGRVLRRDEETKRLLNEWKFCRGESDE